MTNTSQKTERPPVVAVMGHVDHGKSKLLDYIRQTNIVDKEAGGITQSTSAYEVIHNNKKITFIDTPGHAAFTTMRERGAKIADIAILIVSAEEGVKAQTLEALNSIKEQETPFIVAINKIDKASANIEKTKQELAENGVFVEGYGGNIPFVPISAKEGTGVNELLDLILLVAEMEELRACSSTTAEGYILESHLDPRAGISATLIIKNGTIKSGDCLIIGKEIIKIKRLSDFLDKPAKELSFSSPARITGFNQLPNAGSLFLATSDKKLAEELAECYEDKTCQKISPNCDHEDGSLSIPIVIKADVHGTLEALAKELAKIQVEKVYLNIIDQGVGAISENDVKLIQSFPNAMIVGFRVKTEKSAQNQAEKTGIIIQTSDIIYKLSEWLEEKMTSLAPKQKVEETVGRAKVLKVFGKDKDKQIIGGTAVSGKLVRQREVKIIRRDNEVGRGKIVGLQLQKIKVDEVDEGNQFGAEIDARLEIAPGDYLEIFETIMK